MNKIKIINRIINSKFIHGFDCLEEKRVDFHMKITFSERNIEDKLIYKFDVDESKDFFPFFSNETHLKKISDYVILFERRDKLYIIISELKKGFDNSNASKQLEATEIFIKYIISSAKRLGFELTEDDCVFYKIRFSETNIVRTKKRTTRCKDPLHGLPNGTFEYKFDCLHFIHFK